MTRPSKTTRIWLIAVMFSLLSVDTLPGVELIGYVPDYRMVNQEYIDLVLPQQLAMLDEVRYFGMTVTSEGSLTDNSAHRVNMETIQEAIAALPETQRPRFGIALGGAGMSNGFSAVAASSALSNRLAEEIQAMMLDSGAVVIDFDWEHPADGIELSEKYPLLLKTVKQKLGAGGHVNATVAPSKILPHGVFEGSDAIDSVSLMTYDLSWWANDPADVNLGQHSLPEYVDDAVHAWANVEGASIPRRWVFGSMTSVDAPRDKLGIGLPFYGRGFDGSSSEVAVDYLLLQAGGTTNDGNAYEFQGSPIWIPGRDLVAERVRYANEEGLQHIIIWELAQDLNPGDPASLLKTAFETNESFRIPEPSTVLLLACGIFIVFSGRQCAVSSA